MVILPSSSILAPWVRLAACIFLAAGVVVPGARGAGQFVSGVKVVEIYASVSDAKEQPVSGLTAADFLVEEDGVRQDIHTFAAGRFPLALAVALDHSFSVPRTRLQSAIGAVKGMIGELADTDQVMLLGIGSQTEVLAPLSSDPRAALAALARIEPWGTTPIYDATKWAVDEIQRASGRRALVLISDGVDRYSDTAATTLVAHVRQQDVLIYPVALANSRPVVFAELATVSGGRSFWVREPRALPATLSAIATELRTQYLLGYISSSAEDRSGWRSIHVTVSRPGVKVRARDGYLVP
jgi:Ca-activated chloride channel family protein